MRKNRFFYQLLACILVSLMLISGASVANAEEDDIFMGDEMNNAFVTDDGLKYEINNDEITIVGYEGEAVITDGIWFEESVTVS